MTEPLPDAAITAVARKLCDWLPQEPWQAGEHEKVARGLLEAAAPALRKAERERCQAYLRDAAAEHRDLAIEHAYETNTLIARTIDELADLLEGTDG